MCCALLACTLATAAGAAGTASADGGDLAGEGPLELAPIEPGIAPAPGSPSGTALPAQSEPVFGEEGAAVEEVPTGTTAELRSARARLDAKRLRLQSLLLYREQERYDAEADADAALGGIAARLVELFDAGEDSRVAAIIAARDAVDPQQREALVTSLDPADRKRFVQHADALRRAEAVGAQADALRAEVLALGMRIAAIDAVLEGRRTPTGEERARAAGKRFSIDADYVFSTGPIPDIGYWGAATGGGLLSGWMGYAGAAVGGVGCTPPDGSLRATGAVESGEASWYGPGFQGNPTANGERFDTNQLTAAHRTLPFGTIVRVYSSATARCTFVRINDRGPFVDGRVIDLSRAAADAIGMESIAPVQLEVYAPA